MIEALIRWMVTLASWTWKPEIVSRLGCEFDYYWIYSWYWYSIRILEYLNRISVFEYQYSKIYSDIRISIRIFGNEPVFLRAQYLYYLSRCYLQHIQCHLVPFAHIIDTHGVRHNSTCKLHYLDIDAQTESSYLLFESSSFTVQQQ